MIGDDGIAALAYRRASERDTYPCAHFLRSPFTEVRSTTTRQQDNSRR
jgi:hypothetical protein